MTYALSNISPAKPSATDGPVRHFNQIDLSRRWNVSPRTLERWRWLKQGPQYMKIGGHVVYRLEDVESFEAARMRRPAGVTSSIPRK
jgi:hypothetical protein